MSRLQPLVAVVVLVTFGVFRTFAIIPAVCYEIIRLNVWFVVDYRNLSSNFQQPYDHIIAFYELLPERTIPYPNLREYTFTITYSKPGQAGGSEFRTVTQCDESCLSRILEEHKKTSGMPSGPADIPLRRIYEMGPVVDDTDGRIGGLRSFMLPGTKILLMAFIGKTIHLRNIDESEAVNALRDPLNKNGLEDLQSFVPVRMRFIHAAINRHWIKDDLFYNYQSDTVFDHTDEQSFVEAMNKTIERGGFCHSASVCQYRGAVSQCVMAKNGSCYKYADVEYPFGQGELDNRQMKMRFECLTKGLHICQSYEFCIDPKYYTSRTVIFNLRWEINLCNCLDNAANVYRFPFIFVVIPIAGVFIGLILIAIIVIIRQKRCKFPTFAVFLPGQQLTDNSRDSRAR